LRSLPQPVNQQQSNQEKESFFKITNKQHTISPGLQTISKSPMNIQNGEFMAPNQQPSTQHSIVAQHGQPSTQHSIAAQLHKLQTEFAER
jgi:hypothetical protein